MTLKVHPSHPGIPELTAPALAPIAAAFGRRAKAIKYHCFQFGCNRELEDGDERLNVYSRLNDATQISLSAWSSGDMWVSVHRQARGPGGGWAVSFTCWGRIVATTPSRVVELYEQTMAASTEPARLRDIWAPLELSRHD